MLGKLLRSRSHCLSLSDRPARPSMLACAGRRRGPPRASVFGISTIPSCPSLAAQAIKCPRDRFSSMDAKYPRARRRAEPRRRLRLAHGPASHRQVLAGLYPSSRRAPAPCARPRSGPCEASASSSTSCSPRARETARVAPAGRTDSFRIAMWSAQSSPSSASRAATVPRASSSAPPTRKRACRSRSSGRAHPPRTQFGGHRGTRRLAVPTAVAGDR